MTCGLLLRVSSVGLRTLGLGFTGYLDRRPSYQKNRPFQPKVVKTLKKLDCNDGQKAV